MRISKYWIVGMLVVASCSKGDGSKSKAAPSVVEGSAAPTPTVAAGSAAPSGSATAPSPAAPAAAPKECWGTYKVGTRTLTFPNANAAADEPPAEPAEMETISEEFKVTADGGCEIVALFDVSGGHSPDPVTELYKITVKPDGAFAGTLTVQGDLDAASDDKPEVTQLSGKRTAAK